MNTNYDTLDDLQGEAQAHIDSLRSLHERIQALQNDDSDEANEQLIENLEVAIGDVETALMDIVP